MREINSLFFFYGDLMNFIEFEKNVQVMKEKLLEEGISPEDVEIEYTRFDGYNALWAMYERERIVHYFKW